MLRIGHLARIVFRPMAQHPRIVQQTPFIPTNLPMTPSSMMTQTRGMASKKHKKIIKLAKGFRGRANRCYSVAYHRVLKAQQYAYRDRKVRTRSNI